MKDKYAIKSLKEKIVILKISGEENTRLYKKWVKELAELEKEDENENING